MSNVDLEKLKVRATELMQGDESKAEEWLNTASPILGGQTPLDHAKTETGFEDVLKLIGRIRHGVFS
tara:strand:+ start:1826 stop:2026 length:201 start_codon:yes stop_codon:yes gene_type:complete